MSVSYSNDFPPRAGLARWKRPGAPDRYVPAITICWFPRRPQRLRARREGCEVTLRCYDCPGCREFERQRLSRRFVATYRAIAAARASSSGKLAGPVDGNAPSGAPRYFAFTIYCPKESHASTMRGIHRARGVDVAFGFVRAGVESLCMVTTSPSELGAWLGRRRLQFGVRPMSDLNRARSWRHVARGMIVARSAYGENINRWYCRGLIAAEKEKWNVERIREYKPFDRAKDPRVTSRVFGNLLPPSVWQLPRGLRVRANNVLERATTPEAVTSILPWLREFVVGRDRAPLVSAVPKSAEEIERNRAFNVRMARNEPARTEDPISENSSSSSLREEVSELLANSSPVESSPAGAIHSSGAPPPPSRRAIQEEAAAVEASEKHRSEFLAQRSNKKLHEAIERLRALVERVKPKED